MEEPRISSIEPKWLAHKYFLFSRYQRSFTWLLADFRVPVTLRHYDRSLRESPICDFSLPEWWNCSGRSYKWTVSRWSIFDQWWDMLRCRALRHGYQELGIQEAGIRVNFFLGCPLGYRNAGKALGGFCPSNTVSIAKFCCIRVGSKSR